VDLGHLGDPGDEKPHGGPRQSSAVTRRPTYAELLEEEDDPNSRVVKAAEFMRGIEYQIMLRAFHVYETIQVYREQYRMARGFILPLAILGFILPPLGSRRRP
jgi:hypothetical protein